jgi:ATP-dependent helicase/nuclease subunit B
VEETLEADTFGTLIHAVLEEFYKPLEGKEITKADIKAMQPRVAELTQIAFATVYKSEETATGKNLISLKIAQRYVERFLLQELDFVGIRHTVSLIKTEQKLDGKINVNDLVINLRGTADRIDKLDNCIIRVIDYKTGKAAAKEITIKDFGELAFSPDLNKAFQLFFYAWLY